MGSPYAYQSGAGGGTSTGSAGAKNYLGTVNNVNGNGDFELGTTVKWGLGVTGALVNGLPTTTPTFGSGASGNLSISASSSSPNAGSWSMLYASSAATTAGNMVASDAFTIDLEDQAKVMTVKFYFSPTVNPTNGNWSGTSSNSFAWAIYDVTNSAWIIPAGAFGMTQSSGVGICTGTFQTSSNGTSYRFVLYNANATAGALTLKVDDFFLGPQTAPIGPVVTDPVAYTPTLVGFGTTSGVNFVSWRDCAYLWVEGTFTSGTSTATEARIPLGFGGASANVTTISTLPTTSVVGYPTRSSSAAVAFTILAEASKTYLTVGIQDGTRGGLTKQNGDQVISTGATFSFTAKVPIAGWSSNVQMSNDTDTRVVAARITGLNGVTSTTTSGIIKYFTTRTDTHAAYSASTGLFTVPVSGLYRVTNGVNNSSAANSGHYIYLGKNGNTETARLATAAILNGTYSGSAIVEAVAGDTLGIYSSSNGLTIADGTSYAYVNFERLSGPSVIAATETVSALYTGAPPTGTISGAWNAATFGTKVGDTHNAYSGSTYTVPVSGRYQISASIYQSGTYTAGSTVLVGVLIGGTPTYKGGVIQGGVTGTSTANMSVVVPLTAGQAIQIASFNNGTGTAWVSDATLNYFSITRVGN